MPPKHQKGSATSKHGGKAAHRTTGLRRRATDDAAANSGQFAAAFATQTRTTRSTEVDPSVDERLERMERRDASRRNAMAQDDADVDFACGVTCKR